MDESSSAQNRRSRRSHVLMAASIEVDGVTMPVKLRNLSTEGALVEAPVLPPVGSDVRFRKNELSVPGEIAWATGNRAGIAFHEKLDPEAVLRHVPVARQPVKFDFRRPRLKGVDLSPGERKIAEDWIWGNPINNHND